MRILAYAVLLWLVLAMRRLAKPAGYIALVAAPFVIHFADFIIWVGGL
ncbi:hypothetical protein [Allosphingosinicella sp.]